MSYIRILISVFFTLVLSVILAFIALLTYFCSISPNYKDLYKKALEETVLLQSPARPTRPAPAAAETQPNTADATEIEAVLIEKCIEVPSIRVRRFQIRKLIKKSCTKIVDEIATQKLREEFVNAAKSQAEKEKLLADAIFREALIKYQLDLDDWLNKDFSINKKNRSLIDKNFLILRESAFKKFTTKAANISTIYGVIIMPILAIIGFLAKLLYNERDRIPLNRSASGNSKDLSIHTLPPSRRNPLCESENSDHFVDI